MKQIMQELEKLAGLRPMDIIQKKQQGSKVVEFFGDFVPEQWITAAGAESFLICKGGDPQPVEATLDYMLRFMHPLAASMAGNYLAGLDAVMPFADLIAVQQTEAHYGRMTELLEYKKLPVTKIGVPSDYTIGISQDYYRNELKEFRKRLEELVGHPIDDEAIRANYAKTNKINELLRKIDELRKSENAPITFTDFIKLNHYTLHLDYDTSIAALEKIYDKLKDAPAVYEKGAPRIMIMGRAVAKGDYLLPSITEEVGGAIVCEMFDECIRPFHTDISTEGDVVDAYVDAMYINKVPQCIFQPAWNTRFDNVKKLIEEYKIDGILWYQLAFDEIFDMEGACIAKWCNELKVPFIKIESAYEYSREAVAPLTTRLESFVESLKEA